MQRNLSLVKPLVKKEDKKKRGVEKGGATMQTVLTLERSYSIRRGWAGKQGGRKSHFNVRQYRRKERKGRIGEGSATTKSGGKQIRYHRQNPEKKSESHCRDLRKNLWEGGNMHYLTRSERDRFLRGQAHGKGKARVVVNSGSGQVRN